MAGGEVDITASHPGSCSRYDFSDIAGSTCVRAVKNKKFGRSKSFRDLSADATEPCMSRLANTPLESVPRIHQTEVPRASA
jgi:hypothetical protein